MKLDDNQPAAEKTTNSSAQNDIIDKLILCIVMQYPALQRFYILHWPKSLSLSLSLSRFLQRHDAYGSCMTLCLCTPSCTHDRKGLTEIPKTPQASDPDTIFIGHHCFTTGERT